MLGSDGLPDDEVSEEEEDDGRVFGVRAVSFDVLCRLFDAGHVYQFRIVRIPRGLDYERRLRRHERAGVFRKTLLFNPSLTKGFDVHNCRRLVLVNPGRSSIWSFTDEAEGLDVASAIGFRFHTYFRGELAKAQEDRSEREQPPHGVVDPDYRKGPTYVEKLIAFGTDPYSIDPDWPIAGWHAWYCPWPRGLF